MAKRAKILADVVREQFGVEVQLQLCFGGPQLPTQEEIP
jgi:hypothetical protein